MSPSASATTTPMPMPSEKALNDMMLFLTYKLPAISQQRGLSGKLHVLENIDPKLTTHRDSSGRTQYSDQPRLLIFDKTVIARDGRASFELISQPLLQKELASIVETFREAGDILSAGDREMSRAAMQLLEKFKSEARISTDVRSIKILDLAEKCTVKTRTGVEVLPVATKFIATLHDTPGSQSGFGLVLRAVTPNGRTHLIGAKENAQPNGDVLSFEFGSPKTALYFNFKAPDGGLIRLKSNGKLVLLQEIESFTKLENGTTILEQNQNLKPTPFYRPENFGEQSKELPLPKPIPRFRPPRFHNG